MIVECEPVTVQYLSPVVGRRQRMLRLQQPQRMMQQQQPQRLRYDVLAAERQCSAVHRYRHDREDDVHGRVGDASNGLAVNGAVSDENANSVQKHRNDSVTIGAAVVAVAGAAGFDAVAGLAVVVVAAVADWRTLLPLQQQHSLDSASFDFVLQMTNHQKFRKVAVTIVQAVIFVT